MIEVCLLIYKRAPRFHMIMKDLKLQTNQNFRINIWNNSSLFLESNALPEDRIKIYTSMENTGSQARFRLAKLTEGNPIIFFDDDCILAHDFIDYHYKEYEKHGPNCLLGWYNRVFDKEDYWRSAIRSHYGTEVDYIGTGGMIMDRRLIDEEPTLQLLPEKYAKVEDLYLSYIARMKYDMKLIAIDKKCSLLSDEHDQCFSLGNYKQEAFESLRKEGWRLLKDGN